MVAMFEGIEDVEWSNLRHAFGPADEVPALLEKLAAESSRERDRAALELYGCLWHSGECFEVTPHTVPFLVELLDPAIDSDRAWLLSFLTHIANGRPPLEDRREIFGEDFERHAPHGELTPEQERWNDQARRAIRQALPVVGRAARDDDPDVRSAAAYLLAVFRDDADRSLPLIQNQLEHDESPIVRAGAALAVTYLLEGDDDALAQVRRAFENESDDFPRWVCAWIWAMLDPEHICQAALAQMWDVVTHPDNLEEKWARSPWSLIDCASMTCDACRGFDLADDLVTTHRLLKALDHADTYSSLIVADALLQATGVTSIGPWTAAQRAVLEAVAGSDRVWSFNLNARQLMSRYDLPHSRDELRQMIAAS